MPSEIKIDGPGYHYKITSGSPVDPTGPAHTAFLDALVRVTATLSPISLDVMTSGADFTYDLIGAAGRNYHAALKLTGRQRQITGTSFWTLQELLYHNPMIEAIFLLLEASATKVDADWP